LSYSRGRIEARPGSSAGQPVSITTQNSELPREAFSLNLPAVMLLENLTWPDVKKLKLGKKGVLFPLGSFEQHGPHLPLTTDTDIVTAIARRLEQKRPDKILFLPTLWPGHSTHHLFFPGTLSVRQMPYIQLVVELCHSIAKFGGQNVFLLNGFDYDALASRPRQNEAGEARWAEGKGRLSQSRYAILPAGLFRERVSRSLQDRHNWTSRSRQRKEGKAVFGWHRERSADVCGCIREMVRSAKARLA